MGTHENRLTEAASNVYPQSMFGAKIRKKLKKNHLKMNIFTAVKNCCILHGHVFVMVCFQLSGKQLWKNKKIFS